MAHGTVRTCGREYAGGTAAESWPVAVIRTFLAWRCARVIAVEIAAVVLCVQGGRAVRASTTFLHRVSGGDEEKKGERAGRRAGGGKRAVQVVKR